MSVMLIGKSLLSRRNGEVSSPTSSEQRTSPSPLQTLLSSQSECITLVVCGNSNRKVTVIVKI